MGGGTSTLQRARKIIVMRAYNSRPETQTLSDQFEELSRKTPAGKTVLDVNAVKEAIGLTQPWFDDLLLRISGGNAVIL